MSSNIREWLVSRAPRFILSRVGLRRFLEVTATLLDGTVDSATAAAKLRMPSKTPIEDLGRAADDRGVERMPREGAQSFRARLVNAWADHALRGQRTGMQSELDAFELPVEIIESPGKKDEAGPHRVYLLLRHPNNITIGPTVGDTNYVVDGPLVERYEDPWTGAYTPQSLPAPWGFCVGVRGVHPDKLDMLRRIVKREKKSIIRAEDFVVMTSVGIIVDWSNALVDAPTSVVADDESEISIQLRAA